LQKYSFQKLIQFFQEINVLIAPASNTDHSLQEIYLFHQLSWRGLFDRKGAFLNTENYDFQEIFL
jgi:hypothetical protein